MQELEPGDKIQYRLFDKKGKEHWFDGVIHGVRRYETDSIITNVTYLVDTGRDERVDEYTFNERDVEMTRRVNELINEAGEDPTEALIEVSKDSDLPEDKVDIERVRQPEQIELPAEHIRVV